MKSLLTVACVVMVAVCGDAGAKSAGNLPYAAAFAEHGPFYARCIPGNAEGEEGSTQILRVRPEGDEIVATFPWYNRNGIVMGWSPKAGKVAVMRTRQEEGLAPDKQIEFSFYLGEQLLRSYTTDDLVKLGAKLERDAGAIERDLGRDGKRAVYDVEGCKQVPNTNDYQFSIRLDEGKTVAFDITTGELCPNNAQAKVDLNPPKALPAKPTLDAIANLPPHATLEDLLKITGQPGVDFGSAIHQFVFALDDPSTIHVRAHFDGKLISIEHHQFLVTELLHKP